jgi:acyl-CoA reductase-like NAD-dependent aldehyde dehydrogenase
MAHGGVEAMELLHEVARRLRAESMELARTMTAEGGKPLIENRGEVEWTAAAFDYYAEIGRDHAGRVIPPIEASQLAMVVKDPLGMVGCIVPWNYPLLLLAWKVAPALAAGNSIVCADVAAEIEVAARGGAWAAFLNAGQVCTSAERFYVAEEVFDDYVSAFVEHTRSLVLAGPLPLPRRRRRRRARQRPAARGDLRPRGADSPGGLARRGDVAMPGYEPGIATPRFAQPVTPFTTG